MKNKTVCRLLSILAVMSILTAGCAAAGTQTPAGSAENVQQAADTAEEESSVSGEATDAEEEPDSQAASMEDETSKSIDAEENTATVPDIITALPQIDMTKWLYNADDDVYYQIGISYCETPADASQETLAIFVPGAYFAGEDNGDGTFTCSILADAMINGYAADSAPIVIPVNTPGYSAMAPLTDYTDVTEYLAAGFVYVHAGCRGRDSGAPAGVTDLKAAIRYLRYNAGLIAGDTDRIFSFGMSGGGAQSALLGATGDSDLYEDYLQQIGAVQGVSDAVLGSMCWCPITNLDSADAAYEWMMGTTRSGLDEESQAISDALAAAYADYINAEGFLDKNGTVLTLEESDEGVWQAGSYYNYVLAAINESLNNFLSDTEFPYDASSSGGHGGPGGGFGRGGFPGGDFGEGFGGGFEKGEGFGGPENGESFGGFERGEGFDELNGDFMNGEHPSGDFDGLTDFEDLDNITRNATTGGISLSGTYETAQDYIDALNANGEWITYDPETNTAEVTSVADFVTACKNASKNLGAFDQLDGGQGENTLFGYGDGAGAHFDSVLAGILDEAGYSYADAYAEDLAKTDTAGNTVDTRLQMYTPLYYLMPSEDGYETSSVASYWRIRTGIAQSDTSLTTELNLALALENYDGVEAVDFATVWGMQHVEAERTGDSTANFIQWVQDCTQ